MMTMKITMLMTMKMTMMTMMMITLRTMTVVIFRRCELASPPRRSALPTGEEGNKVFTLPGSKVGVIVIVIFIVVIIVNRHGHPHCRHRQQHCQRHHYYHCHHCHHHQVQDVLAAFQGGREDFSSYNLVGLSNKIIIFMIINHDNHDYHSSKLL